jgi:hypothetical protein
VRVLVVPVLIGITLPDGYYAYFSEKYSFETAENVTTTTADRETTLADAQARLPHGRIFRLLAYGMATHQGRCLACWDRWYCCAGAGAARAVKWICCSCCWSWGWPLA